MNATQTPAAPTSDELRAMIDRSTHRTQARIGAFHTLIRDIAGRQDCRINRVQTAYLLDRLGVEMRHLDRLREQAERLQRAETPQ